jgi:hypothetical protein
MRTVITCKAVCFVLVLGALHVAADESVAADPINNYADLNAATASLKLGSPSWGQSRGNTALSKVLKMLFMAVMTFLAAWVLTNKGEAIFEYLRASVAPVAAHLLVYAISGGSSTAGTELRSPAGKKAAERKTFSLDSRLDIAHLPDGVARRRFSMGLENRLMPATLELPMSTSKTTPTASPMLRARSNSGINRRYGEMSPSLGAKRLPQTPEVESITMTPRQEATRRDPQPVRRHPGTKPNFKRLQDQNLAQAPSVASRVQEDMEALLDSDSEWDSDWEDEPRAPSVPRGEEMEGYDVGIIPQRVLKLPQPAARYIESGLYGRSILTSIHQFPTMS